MSDAEKISKINVNAEWRRSIPESNTCCWLSSRDTSSRSFFFFLSSTTRRSLYISCSTLLFTSSLLLRSIYIFIGFWLPSWLFTNAWTTIQPAVSSSFDSSLQLVCRETSRELPATLTCRLKPFARLWLKLFFLHTATSEILKILNEWWRRPDLTRFFHLSNISLVNVLIRLDDDRHEAINPPSTLFIEPITTGS